MPQPRAWITGIGAATPLGCDYSEICDNLYSGKSAAQLVIDHNIDGEFRSPGSVMHEPPVPAGWSEQEFRALPRVEQATLWSCAEALRQAGWWNNIDGMRIGLILGVGGEWIRHWEVDAASGGDDLYRGEEQSSLIERTQQRLGLHGPTTTIAAACASGNYAIQQARRWIEQGLVDVCIAGGIEIVTPVCRAAFHNLRALSRNIDDVSRASRPFDADRDGFVMGEGAISFVLEADHVAKRRSVRPLAEVAGFGASSDAYHMIIPSSDPQPAAKAISRALVDAQLTPAEISYINAHAPGTPVGDKAEAKALQLVFGPDIANTPVSSTKSITGHLLSAAAAMEALIGIAALEHQKIPPTLNLDHPDPDCDLCHVPHHAIETPVHTVLSNSFGFGGSNTSLVLRKVA